jgi:hypothetical protein
MSPTKRLNGKKRPTTPACPHVEVCNAPTYHSEVMASIDELSRSVGMLLERHEQHTDRLHRLTSHMSDVSERLTVTAQREAEWIRTLGEMTRVLAALQPQGGVHA